MPITRNDFKDLPSSGQIPDDRVPASEFAVSYYFQSTGYLDPSNPNQSFKGDIKLHVLDSAGNLKYEILLHEEFNFFIFPLLYTWNWVPTAEKITGTKADGSAMSTLGAATFGVDPAEGSGVDLGSAEMDCRFYSGIFTEPLSPGDHLKIIFHNLSAGFLVDQASLQLATLLGGFNGCFVRNPQQGKTFYIYQGKTGLQCHVTRQETGFTPSDSDPLVVAGTARNAWLSLHNTGLLCLADVSGLHVIGSANSGQTWEEKMPVVTDITPLATVPSADGGAQYLLATAAIDGVEIGTQGTPGTIAKGDLLRVILRGSKGAQPGQDLVIALKQKVTGTLPPKTGIVGLHLHNTTFRLLVNDGGKVRWFDSLDFMQTWTEKVSVN